MVPVAEVRRCLSSTMGGPVQLLAHVTHSSSLRQTVPIRAKNRLLPRWRMSIALPAFLAAYILTNVFVVTKRVVYVSDKDHRTADRQTKSIHTLPRQETKKPTNISSEIVPNSTRKDILHPSSNTTTIVDVVVVAHVVSLIKCKKESSVTGFLDAAAVLRHSIHKNSVHNPSSGSKYSYKMYAIVHESCQSHARALDRLGYTSLIKPSPILLDDIQPGWYRDHVEGENCCGSAEFIKLYAYTLLEHPINVHWDMDVAIFQPMDDLFDSMLFDEDTPEGQRARSRLEVQHPHRPLPPRIDAFFTRDITSAQPWEVRQGVQGGFLVSRPSMDHFERYRTFIKRGNYTGGRGNGRGWDNLGYGGFQGAMAYQGAVAYFYDQIATNTAVELDVCIWNQVVADVIWRGPDKMEHYGQCREYPTRVGDTHAINTPENGRCRDCRILPVDQVKSAHYTACKKPWECTMPHPRNPQKARANHKHRLQELTNVTTCGLLFRKWFDLRRDFEETLLKTGNVTPSRRDGSYETQYFGGYCQRQFEYIAMEPPPEDFDITRMYGM